MANELALKGGVPLRSKPYPTWPVWGDAERRNLFEVLESGTWSFGGPMERVFEARFAEFCGANHAFCVANGSVSLEIALSALGVGPGDEVIVPALTWVATAWAVVRVGATPVFADVQGEDWCISPSSIRDNITDRTRAVIPVHLYSQIAEMDDIMGIAQDASLWIVEDCAHAHGACWGSQSVGTLGHIGSYSFQQTKGMTSGEGGALVTGDEGLAGKIYGLKNCGRPWKPGGEHGFGTNYRITEFQAAVLLAQLERLEAQLEEKSRNIALFREMISSIPGIEPLPPKQRATRQGLYAFALHYDPKIFGNIPRSVLVEALKAEGIPVVPPYNVVYRSPLWLSGEKVRRWGSGVDPRKRLGLDSKCPVAEEIAEHHGLTIPHEVFLGTPGDIEDLVAGFDKIRRCASELRFDAFQKRARTSARKMLEKVGIGV